MNLNDVLGAVERRKNPKRRGRGEGSGLGKSSGRGNKGAKARSGWRRRYGYEGGQMPIARRVPKRGFNNFNFASYFDVLNVRDLEGSFEDGATVNRQVLVDSGLLKPRHEQLKLLGDGELKKKLNVTVHAASAEAKKKIEAAGGTLTCLNPPRKIRKPVPRPAPGGAGGKAKPEAGAGAAAEAKPKKDKGAGGAGKAGGAPEAKAKKEKKPEAGGDKGKAKGETKS